MTQELVSHWHPNLTINIVTDQTNWVYGQIPPPLDTCKLFITSCKISFVIDDTNIFISVIQISIFYLEKHLTNL